MEKGGGLHSKTFYHFTATSCSCVNNTQNGESGVQCGGGREPVLLRRLVFPSHSAENDEYSSWRVDE